MNNKRLIVITNSLPRTKINSDFIELEIQRLNKQGYTLYLFLNNDVMLLAREDDGTIFLDTDNNINNDSGFIYTLNKLILEYKSYIIYPSTRIHHE